MRPVVLILLGLSCGAIGLKCRSQEGATDAELKRIVRSCMQRSSSSNSGGNNQDQDDERYYGNQRYNFDMDYGQERGQGQGQGQRQQQSYDNRWRRSSKQSDSNNNNNNKGNNTSEMGPCVAQCFFEEMNMVSNHRHVAFQAASIIFPLSRWMPAGSRSGARSLICSQKT